MKVQTVGFDVLSLSDKKDFQRLLDEYALKIERQLKNIDSFIIHLKEHGKGGKRKKYSIHVRVTAPTHTIEADAADWDFLRTVHKVFNKLGEEIEHTFHIRDQHKHKTGLGKLLRMFKGF